MNCYIVGAGDFYMQHLKPQKEDFIIAADAGFKCLEKIGITPDLIIGDFDSANKPDYDNTIVLPKEKNDTDMLFCIKKGLSLGYKIFYIFGGTGGRFDHTVANLQCLAFLSKNGATGFLFDKINITTAITNDSLEFDENSLGYISIFSYSEHSIGVTLKNLKYRLNKASLSNDFPIGVSNEFIGKKSSVSVERGTLIVITEGVLPL